MALMTKFHKSDIARLQLETAVGIFLCGLDRSAVITLAGAASGILDTLVRRAGKEPFVDYARRVRRELTGQMPKRESYAHHINKALGVIAHKHLAEGEPEIIELDLERQAINALKRAVSEFVSLNGSDLPFVRSFLNWTWVNENGPSVMEKFKSTPKRMRPK